MRTYLILLLVASIMLLSVNAGSAYTYKHTITPLSPVVGSIVTDKVTPIPGSSSFLGYKMRFKWTRPDATLARIAFAVKSSNSYMDSFPPDTAGRWTINADEYFTDQIRNSPSSSLATFTVVPAPEFSKFGLAVPLFLIGIFYMRLRKVYIEK